MTQPSDPIYPGPASQIDRPREFRSSKAVAITAIISCTFIILTCILAAAVVASYFFANAPWG